MRSFFEKDRLNALTDGVIAIAITLLVLAIDIPEGHDFSESGLRNFLMSMEPDIVAFITSFIVVSIYWVQHYRIFNELKSTDRRIIILNLLFLLTISLAPFASKVKSMYRYDELALLLFASIHIITGMTLFTTWRYICKTKEVQKQEIPEKNVTMVGWSILISPIVCLLVIILGFVNIHIATYLFVIIPLVYIRFSRY